MLGEGDRSIFLFVVLTLIGTHLHLLEFAPQLMLLSLLLVVNICLGFVET